MRHLKHKNDQQEPIRTTSARNGGGGNFIDQAPQERAQLTQAKPLARDRPESQKRQGKITAWQFPEAKSKPRD